jgi:hypothetical protein
MDRRLIAARNKYFPNPEDRTFERLATILAEPSHPEHKAV